MDARLERAWNTYADDYVLRLDKGEYVLGVADTVRISREFLAQAWGEEFQADGRVIVEIGTGQGRILWSQPLLIRKTTLLVLRCIPWRGAYGFNGG